MTKIVTNTKSTIIRNLEPILYGSLEFQYIDDSPVPIYKPMKKQWLYLFVKFVDGSEPAWLDAEYWLDEHSNAHHIDLKAEKNKDVRQISTTLPVAPFVWTKTKVNNRKINVYVCSSPFQFNWKRIRQLANNPASRCYKIGENSTRGSLWDTGDGSDDRDLIPIAEEALNELPEMQVLRIVGVRDLLTLACRRNREFCQHLDTYLSVRFNTIAAQDDDGNTQYTMSDSMSKNQLEQLTAGLIFQRKRSIPYSERFIVNHCLKNDGDDFEAYVQFREEAHWKAHYKMHDSLTALKTIMYEENWEGVEADVAAMLDSEHSTETAAAYMNRSIQRLDELEQGRELLLKLTNGNGRYFSNKTGVLVTGEATYKAVKPHIKIVTSIAKVIVCAAQMPSAVKKAEVSRLLKFSLDINLNVISERILIEEYLKDFNDKHFTKRPRGEENFLKSYDKSYIKAFDDAAEFKSIEYEKFSIAPEDARRLSNAKELEFEFSKISAVLDGLSLAIIASKWISDPSSLKTKDHVETAKNFSALLIFVGKLASEKNIEALKKFSDVTKKVNPYTTILFSITDAIFTGIDAQKEFSSDDINAGVAKTVSASSSIFVAGGTFLMFFPPTLAVGVGVVAVATVTGALSDIWYIYANDNAMTLFLKHSPWGIKSEKSNNLWGLEDNLKTYINSLEKKV